MNMYGQPLPTNSSHFSEIGQIFAEVESGTLTKPGALRSLWLECARISTGPNAAMKLYCRYRDLMRTIR